MCVGALERSLHRTGAIAPTGLDVKYDEKQIEEGKGLLTGKDMYDGQQLNPTEQQICRKLLSERCQVC